MIKPIGLIRQKFICKGRVQGVGFRPAIARLAGEDGFGGYVQNTSAGVIICLEGEESGVRLFKESLRDRLPPLIIVEEIDFIHEEHLFEGESIRPFSIEDSLHDAQINMSLPADLAICKPCSQEIFDPSNRRYLYPFTTCTHCGPRYTLVEELPYDRERTLMSEFPLCQDCLREYNEFSDRRYHAESLACPQCGPRLEYVQGEDSIFAEKALLECRNDLRNNKIVAIKGLGGYQIALNPFTLDLIRKLREKKNRPAKAFALMAANLSVAKKYVEVSEQEESVLLSPQAPILILKRRSDLDQAQNEMLDLICPDSSYVGLMLPTTPLHMLLFARDFEKSGFPELLLMTSANAGGEPICIHDNEAEERLSFVCDSLLKHNRKIRVATDDSVLRVNQEQSIMYRRARGYAPDAIKSVRKSDSCILAMGADLKNTIAFMKNEKVYLSQHIGDLELAETQDSLHSTLNSFKDYMKVDPRVVVVDRHPGYYSHHLGKRIAKEYSAEILEVQHHHAHGMACLTENKLEKGLALVFDGTGYGTEGELWGAECLFIEGNHFERLGSFQPVPLPGADAAVKDIRRQLVGRMAGMTDFELNDVWRKKLNISEDELATWLWQSRQSINAPLSSGAGRLFDAVASLLGLGPDKVSYEGQAAIRLEETAMRSTYLSHDILPYDICDSESMRLIDWSPMFLSIFENRPNFDQNRIAAQFHHTLASAALKMALFAREKSGVNQIALSGGVFQNILFSSLIMELLTNNSFEVFCHKDLPANDGSISYGQAVVAAISL
ncbi:MAG: carbamoyltransferase HypF [Planctomycetes bacterium]|nr:carbamoyltransferase HypF [Planctomycetota bacterium]